MKLTYNRYKFQTQKTMEYDAILQVLTKNTSKNDIWKCVNINPRSKYIALHSSVMQFHMLNVLQFLVEEWNSKLVNNSVTQYTAEQCVGFYLFDTCEPDSDRQRCDFYGKWKNNGVTRIELSNYHIKRSYFHLKKNGSFKKVEYHLQTPIDNKYRGLIIYYRPLELSSSPAPTSPHKNVLKRKRNNPEAEISVQSFQRQPNDTRRTVKEKVAHKRDPRRTYTRLLGKDGAKPRNSKQVDNMQQQFRDPKHELDHIVRLQQERKDIIRHIGLVPHREIVFFTDQAVQWLRKSKAWFADTTFNLGTFYGTSVVFQHELFHHSRNVNPIICSFFYLHQVSTFYIYY
jgi:hypothetical protein